MPSAKSLNVQQSRAYQQISGMIPSWEDLDLPWGAKDLESRFIYANTAYKRLLGLPEHFDLEGRYDSELPAPTSEFAEQFQIHDRVVEADRMRRASLEINEFGPDRELSAYFFDKAPLYDRQKNVLGTTFMGRKAVHLTTDFYLNGGRPNSIILNKPSDAFTDTQWDIIFLLIQRYSQKEIANRLNMAPKTVNNHISSIYAKVDVTNHIQFIDYIKNHGWANYVPEKYFRDRRHITFF